MSTLETPPAANAPDQPPKSAKPVRIGRIAIGFNVLIQLVVVFAIVALVNYLCFRHFKRWDFSRNQKFALSSQTRNVLDHLDQPVQAIVFFPQAQMLFGDVSALLREYEFASGRKFVMELVDPYRNLNRARELSEKYKFGDNDNIVILDYKGKTKFVKAQDMAEIDTSGAMFNQPPTMKAFKGEEAITSALMELTEEHQNKIYLVGGHGEPSLPAPQQPAEQPPALQGDEIDSFIEALKRQNIKTAALDLSNVDAVPADATGLLIFGPKTDFSERDIKLVSDFWNEKKGRLFILLNAAVKTPRLDEWLATQGVTPQDDRVLKTGTVMVLDQQTNQPALRNGVMTSPAAVFIPAGKPVTKDVSGEETQLLGATKSLALDRSKGPIEKIQMTPILEAGDGYWGSTTYGGVEGKQVFFDPKKDIQGPLTLGVAVEKGALEDPRVKVDTARMVVIGNAGFLTEKGLQMSEVNSDFALNAINWMFNRESVAGIAAKPKQPVKLSLDEKKMNNLALLVMGGIPGLVALIGLAVWWQRRS